MEANQRLSGSKCAVNRRSLFAQNRKMLHVVILNLANRMLHVVILANRRGYGPRGKIGDGVTHTKQQTSSLTWHASGMRVLRSAFDL